MLSARIEAGFSRLLDKKATENGISIIAAIPLLLSDIIPEKMKSLICEEYNLSLPEGATFLDALNIAAKKARSTENDKESH
ncbi:MAG: hypothetical protein Q4D44_08160 [Eubacteriales bacterium]|nr:hypothetical protein [Eubacteriales bacterium]